jgi:hypothetical protein
VIGHVLAHAVAHAVAHAATSSSTITTSQHNTTVTLEQVIIGMASFIIAGVGTLIYRTGRVMQIVVDYGERIVRLETWRDTFGGRR